MNTRARAVTVSILSGGGVMVVNWLMNYLARQEIWSSAADYSDIAQLAWLFTVLAVGSSWMLFFKIDRQFLVGGVMYPFMILLPFWQIAKTILTTLQDSFTAGIAYILAAIIVGMFVYVLLLTINLLNGSRLRNVPLGQAAKAVQFVMILVASYLTYTFVVNSGFPVWFGGAVVFVYVAYTTFAAVSLLELKLTQKWAVTMLLALVMSIVFLIISVWPLNSIYTSLVLTVVHYLLLNFAVEMREKMTVYIWIEYGLLVSLAVFVMLANAEWGTQGTII